MTDLQIFECVQGEPAWFACRLGIPTASRFKDVLAKGQGLTRRKYLYTLASEALTGEVAESYTNEHMERGKAMEADAREMYAFKYGVEPVQVGFMRRGDAGCSPDSLLGDDGLLEIKTKLPALHLECLELNRLPPEHVAQVQGQLWVSGRQWTDFVSYWPKLPLFCIRVHRDDAYIAMLAAEVQAFNAELRVIVNKYREKSA
ncbi:MAG: lambda exonuclease family protein [Acidobacteriaceae bacterium]